MTEDHDPLIMRHRHLEQIALAALSVGRMLMETGGKSALVSGAIRKVSKGLGSESVHNRIG